MTWDVSISIWQEKGLLQRELKLYEALEQEGIETTIVTWGGAEDRKVINSIKENNIKFICAYDYIPRPSSKILRSLCSILIIWKIQKPIKQTDIIKTNQMWGGWVAACASLFLRKPLIARCGFELYDFTCKQNHKKLRRIFIWCISKLTYTQAKHICVASEDDKKTIIQNFKQNKEKISVHSNWIDVKCFSPSNETKKKKNHILYVGRFTDQKNLPLLLKSIKQTDITLDMVGNGELKQSIKEYPGNINLLGKVPNNKLPEIYNTYPIYVLCSHYEGNPKTLLEAMSCGSAVIGTNVPGISSVIQHEKDGLLCEPNEESLKNAIIRLSNDEDLRGRLGKHARKKILETQSLEKLVEKELNLYERVVNA